MPSYAPTALMIDDRGLAESFRRRGCGIVAVLQGAPDSGIKVNLNTFASTSTKSATQSSSLTSFIYHGYKTTKNQYHSSWRRCREHTVFQASSFSSLPGSSLSSSRFPSRVFKQWTSLVCTLVDRLQAVVMRRSRSLE
jgi:hypothetical protein